MSARHFEHEPHLSINLGSGTRQKVLTPLPYPTHARCTKALKRKSATIPNSRWLAYATAGAASAFTCANSAEAAIHYSGPLHVKFPPNKNKSVSFPLDQAGDFFQFVHSASGSGRAGLDITGIVSANLRGFRGCTRYCSSSNVFSVEKLSLGQNISSGNFTFSGGILYSVRSFWYRYGQWGDRGFGFVGFRFNNGAGFQYGWARVKMSDLPPPQIAFAVRDYAYADPGEPITAGQRSSDERAPDQGSLGWLATGAVGFLAWRKSRSRTAWR